MINKKSSLNIAVISALSLAIAHQVHAATPSLTAQSAMMDFTYDSAAYQIEGTITWTFHRNIAETFYTNVWDGNAPVVTTGTGSPQTSPGVPAASSVALQNFVQQQRCIFFAGGDLLGTTYNVTVNGTRGWKWTYTFIIAPTQTSVAAYEGGTWTSVETGGTVDVNFGGFIASESFLNNGSKNKYSFTLLDNSVSRVSGVTAQLEKSYDDVNWSAVGNPLDLNNLDTNGDTVNDSLAVSSTSADYSYYGNGGIFGKSGVYGALHADNYKLANSVTQILSGTNDGTTYADNFAGNDNDLAAGNVHQANFSGTFSGLSEEASYRTVISGTIKGNGGSASQSFSVSKNTTVIGGCNQ